MLDRDEQRDMARGKERKWIHKVKAWTRKFDACRKIYNICGILEIRCTDVTIHSGHALEGVRVNGHQRLTAGLRVIRDLQVFRAKITGYAAELELAADEAKREIDKLTDQWNHHFHICERCKGHSGGWSSKDGKKRLLKERPLNMGYDWYWEDCPACEGRGHLED